MPVVCKEVLDISNILWGPSVKIDVFRRWAQGELSRATIRDLNLMHVLFYVPNNYHSNSLYFSCAHSMRHALTCDSSCHIS